MKRHIPPDLESRTFDLAVIGGGINGAAIARDAALRGLVVILLEKSDFASGTTSWSTRLIHGGLRYLEHRELGLVYESLRERERLLHNAPHLVKPIPLVLPVYSGASRRPITLRAGLTLYDLLSARKSTPRHVSLSAAETRKRWPGLAQEGLQGAFRFYDAQVAFPERLVLENIESAVEAGAVALNYARVDGIIATGTVVQGLAFTDGLTGTSHTVRSRVVVNVTGPWVDSVLELVPGEREKKLIGGTKGSHIFLDHFPGTPIDGIYCEARADRRPIFVLPWNGLIMAGTTDIRFAGDLDETHATNEEIDYLLAEVNALFPGHDLNSRDVLFSYAGVRPLPATNRETTGDITRRHFFVDHAPEHQGLYSIVGGKLTTHRSLAESMVDEACQALGVRAECPTKELPLPGSPGMAPDRLSRELASAANLPIETTDRLVSIYGKRASEIATWYRKQELPDGLDAEAQHQSLLSAEIEHVFSNEMAQNLSDAMLRRCLLGYQDGMGIAAAEQAARIGVERLGWTEERARQELEDYRVEIQRFRLRTVAPTLL